MDDKQMIAVHEQRIISLEARMKAAEKQAEATHELALSVKELTVNQTQMLKEQQDQGQRIRVLEEEPLQRMKQIKMRIIECIATGIVSALLGVILGYFLR